VICTISPDLFRIDITDEGDGFDPALVPDCTQEDRLTVPSGRGVMLMRSFMTRIEYNAKGNRVVLEKTPSPEAA
jgi:serine/threonine-protein kinase RsbW